MLTAPRWRETSTCGSNFQVVSFVTFEAQAPGKVSVILSQSLSIASKITPNCQWFSPRNRFHLAIPTINPAAFTTTANYLATATVQFAATSLTFSLHVCQFRCMFVSFTACYSVSLCVCQLHCIVCFGVVCNERGFWFNACCGCVIVLDLEGGLVCRCGVLWKSIPAP
jgi:hypothetical protein